MLLPVCRQPLGLLCHALMYLRQPLLCQLDDAIMLLFQPFTSQTVLLLSVLAASRLWQLLQSAGNCCTE
jgi:hypothetical protein